MGPTVVQSCLLRGAQINGNAYNFGKYKSISVIFITFVNSVKQNKHFYRSNL